MKSKQPSQSKALVWAAGVGAGAVIILLVISIRSLVLLFAGPHPEGAPRPESAEAEIRPGGEPGRQHEPASEEQGAQSRGHEAGPMAPLPAPAAPALVPQKAAEFAVDYETLRDRETGRRQMTEKLREIANESPESGYAIPAEQLRKVEQSGASFQ